MSLLFSKKKKSPYKKTTELPKTAQDTIPFIEAYDNGLFLVDENKYTIIFAYEDIDYILIRDSEQEDVYQKYIKLLNSLPTHVQYQEFIMNTEIDVEVLRKAIVPDEAKNRFGRELYRDYCHIMDSYVAKANQGASKKIRLIAMSFSPKSKFEDATLLLRYYRDIQTYFQAMKSDTKQLQPMEVFSILHKFYHQFDHVDFLLPKNFLSRGRRIKDYIAPSMFSFKPARIKMMIKAIRRNSDEIFRILLSRILSP